MSFYLNLRRLTLLASLLFSAAAAGETKVERIVTIGAAVTETVYALGLGAQVVGRDQTSMWPAAVHRLPDIGYPRNLGIEGILSLKPTLILASHDAGPPHVIEGLKATGIEVMVVPTGPTWTVAEKGLMAIAGRLGKSGKQQAALTEVRAKLEQAAKAAEGAATEKPAKVLFLMAEGPGGWLAAGNYTRAQALLEAAGAENALGSAKGYKPLGPEAMLALSPDAILLASHSLRGKGDLKTVLAQAGLDRIPAVQQNRLHIVDTGKFLTLGPRFGEASLELAQLLAE